MLKKSLNYILLCLLIIGIILTFILLYSFYLTNFFGDAATFWGTLATVYGGFLLYQQIKDQEVKYKLDTFSSNIKNLYFMLNSINYESKIGSDAIVEYGLNFEEVMNKRPRVVLDNTIFLVEAIKNLLFEIKESSKYLGVENSKKLILDILFFYYFNLYYPIAFGRGNDENSKGLYHKIEKDKYGLFIQKIHEIMCLSYVILTIYGRIDKHTESENLFKVENIQSDGFRELYNFLK